MKYLNASLSSAAFIIGTSLILAGCSTNIGPFALALGYLLSAGALSGLTGCGQYCVGFFDEEDCSHIIVNPAREDADQDGYFWDDCNDLDANIHPEAQELCYDAIDNNCDGSVDEEPCYYISVNPAPEDADQDGYFWDDCNDLDANIHPGAQELCYDAIDNNCDGSVDEEDCSDISVNPAPEDADQDGYFWDDCNDLDANIHPGAREVCDDAIDNNCDGSVDEEDCGDISVNPAPEDADQDGDGYPHFADCNDFDAAVHPGAIESCNDAIDNNCDGVICELISDENSGARNVDNNPTSECAQSDETSNPPTKEICYDSLDNDCDGDIDEQDDDCASVL
jgi:large repetitive protein